MYLREKLRSGTERSQSVKLFYLFFFFTSGRFVEYTQSRQAKVTLLAERVGGPRGD